jgi:hypothetical protein
MQTQAVDLRNASPLASGPAAAEMPNRHRLGAGATTLRRYTDPVSEVERRAGA